MRRFQLLELEDQGWLPSVLREAGMAYLRFAGEKLGAAEHLRPLIEDALARSGEKEIVDLCSGGGGPVMAIAEALARAGDGVPVTMTDLFPDPGGIECAEAHSIHGLRYDPAPTDALSIPGDRPGLRTIFNAFHHLTPSTAESLLASAVSGNRAIAVVEFLQRRPLALLGMIFTPIVTLFAVPFLRPFRWQWIPLTYLVPLVPLLILWDGVVSIFRIYDEEELLAMAANADPGGVFEWKVHTIPMDPAPVPGIALVGIPR